MDSAPAFTEGLASWRRVLASMPDSKSKYTIFANAAADIAAYVTRGFAKADAVDALQEMASSNGLAQNLDLVQTIISDAFVRAEETAERITDDLSNFELDGYQQQQKANGHARPTTVDDIPLVFPFPIDEASIPVRDWVIPGLLMRGHVSVVVAPSGSGKSLLTLQLSIACAQGRRWAGWMPRDRFRVLVINSEDDINEMRRRLAAAAHVMELDEKAQIEIRQHIALVDSSRKGAVVAKINQRSKTFTTTPLFDKIVEIIKLHKIDIVFVDPFAETFEGDENSNSELKWVGALWRRVARETNVALCLIHHTKKYATGMAGDVDAARGASALIGIARIVSTLFPMTTREAEVMLKAKDREKHGFYLRYDDAKANLNIKSPFARWFFKQTITLNNATEELPGDDVGVLIPWSPEGPNVLESQIIAFFKRVDQGVLDQDGKQTGEFYSFGNRASDRSIVEFAQEFFQIDTRAAAEKLIAGWKHERRLEQIDYRSPKQRRTRARAISELDPTAPRRKAMAQAAQAQPQQDEFNYGVSLELVAK